MFSEPRRAGQGKYLTNGLTRWQHEYDFNGVQRGGVHSTQIRIAGEEVREVVVEGFEKPR